MPRANASVPLAVLAALSLALVSYACVVSCWGVEAAIPPCHHHKSSCAPLLLTAEAPGNSAAVPNLVSSVIVAVATPLNSGADAELDPVPFSSPPRSPSRVPAILRI
jgi:hypothetical protein